MLASFPSPRVSFMTWRVLVVVLLCSGQSAIATEPELRLDLRKPRAEVRAALLKVTPLQTPAADVVSFITKHLQPNADTGIALTEGPAPGISGSKPRGAKFIRLYLGQYYDHPEVVFLAAPIMSQREVTAFWIFDEKGKLMDLVVDKQTGVY
ncbi:MAG: hypothetical protein M3Y69_01160 [Verrucomicrobiota bacterium]|nr:hypothetical protein [Verrucomicrobiota bacterium]